MPPRKKRGNDLPPITPNFDEPFTPAPPPLQTQSLAFQSPVTNTPEETEIARREFETSKRNLPEIPDRPTDLADIVRRAAANPERYAVPPPQPQSGRAAELTTGDVLNLVDVPALAAAPFKVAGRKVVREASEQGTRFGRGLLDEAIEQTGRIRVAGRDVTGRAAETIRDLAKERRQTGKLDNLISDVIKNLKLPKGDTEGAKKILQTALRNSGRVEDTKILKLLKKGRFDKPSNLPKPNVRNQRLTQRLLILGGATIGTSALVVNAIGSYPFSGFVEEEAIQTLSAPIVTALINGDFETAELLRTEIQQFLNSRNNIISKIPYANVVYSLKRFFRATEIVNSAWESVIAAAAEKANNEVRFDRGIRIARETINDLRYYIDKDKIDFLNKLANQPLSTYVSSIQELSDIERQYVDALRELNKLRDEKSKSI